MCTTKETIKDILKSQAYCTTRQTERVSNYQVKTVLCYSYKHPLISLS
jgi:hypothetical protein